MMPLVATFIMEKYFALIVEFDWGTVDLGMYTQDEIDSFREEYIGPPESITILDPATYPEMFMGA